MNIRNSKNSNAQLNAHGIPVCPLDGAEFTFLGKSGGKNASAVVILHAHLPPTENAFIVTLIRIFDSIPGSSEIRRIGIIFTATELQLKEPLT